MPIFAYIFFRHDWPDLNITYPSVSVDWNAEKGYDASMPPDVIPWRPYGAGLFYGLTLVLDVETSEYYCSSTAGMGFKVSRYKNPLPVILLFTSQAKIATLLKVISEKPFVV